MTQSDIKFLTFNDGVAFVFDTDENDTIIANTARKYRFGNEKSGLLVTMAQNKMILNYQK